MNRLMAFIKQFFSKEFITFAVIGVINTIINFCVYFAVLFIFSEETNFFNLVFKESNEKTIFIQISGAIAFIVASVFSYLLNSHYTFKKKTNYKTFFKVFGVLILKFLSEQLLIFIFGIIISRFLGEDYKKYSIIFAQIILIPATFLAFKVAYNFKRKAVCHKTEETGI